MFEQSQLELSSSAHRKSTSMMIGFALQGMLLAGALLFSLLITEAVPRISFNPSLLAPPRSKRNFISIAQPLRQSVPVNFTPRPSALYAPREIPRNVVILDAPQVPRAHDPAPLGHWFLARPR
jgi:hypothetical protein